MGTRQWIQAAREGKGSMADQSCCCDAACSVTLHGVATKTNWPKPAPFWGNKEWALPPSPAKCKLLSFSLFLVRMHPLPGGEWVKRHDLRSVPLAAGIWGYEPEVVGIITAADLLCGNGLKASCFLSRSYGITSCCDLLYYGFQWYKIKVNHSVKIRVDVKHMYKPCPFPSSLYEETSTELFTINCSSLATLNKATHCLFAHCCLQYGKYFAIPPHYMGYI